MKTLSILLIVVAVLSSDANAQQFEKATGLTVEYWRAFHGVIKQEVVFTKTGEIALNTTVFPGMTEAQQNENKQHTLKTIKRQDVAAMLTLFNYADVRQFFATTKSDDRADGSALTITLTQNSFSMTFTTQDAFTRGSSRFSAALGRAAVDLFTKAGITIPKNELY